MNRRVVSWAFLFVVMLGLSQQAVLAQDMPAATDHAALAAMYAADAKAARAKAASHQLMLDRYKSVPSFPKGASFPKEALVEHCQKLVSSYTEAGKQAEQMAKMERELASAGASQ